MWRVFQKSTKKRHFPKNTKNRFPDPFWGVFDKKHQKTAKKRQKNVIFSSFLAVFAVSRGIRCFPKVPFFDDFEAKNTQISSKKHHFLPPFLPLFYTSKKRPPKKGVKKGSIIIHVLSGPLLFHFLAKMTQKRSKKTSKNTPKTPLFRSFLRSFLTLF